MHFQLAIAAQAAGKPLISCGLTLLWRVGQVLTSELWL